MYYLTFHGPHKQGSKTLHSTSDSKWKNNVLQKAWTTTKNSNHRTTLNFWLNRPSVVRTAFVLRGTDFGPQSAWTADTRQDGSIRSCFCLFLTLLYIQTSQESHLVWFEARCVQRCSPAYFGCNKLLFEILLPSYQVKAAWPLSSNNKAFSPSEPLVPDSFLLLREPHTWLCRKIPAGSADSKIAHLPLTTMP